MKELTCADCGLTEEHCLCPPFEITKAVIPEWKPIEPQPELFDKKD